MKAPFFPSAAEAGIPPRRVRDSCAAFAPALRALGRRLRDLRTNIRKSAGENFSPGR